MGQHAVWRKLVKKLRRKRIRKQAAILRFQEEEKERLRKEQSPSYAILQEEQRKAEEFQQEEEARLAAEREAEWLRVEEEAQKQWRELQKRLESIRQEREKQNEAIRLEWELAQQRLKEKKLEKERKEEEERKKQEKLIEQIDEFVKHGGKIPRELRGNIETNPGKPVCPFFHKTGACRFREGCSRNHVRPQISRIIMIPNFYTHYSLEQIETEYGSDSGLEYENKERYEHFSEFFFDVLPEMEKCGRIRQFKVCCNREGHLRGNVYVEYASSRDAVQSFRMFHGRYYGGKQLNVEFCNIESWKSAICGLHFKHRCPKGSACNFLHVFRNPEDMFHRADKDMHRTPPRIKYDETTPDTRNWRWSESPERREEVENCRRKRHRNGEARHDSKERKSEKRKREHRSRIKERHKKRNSERDKT